MIQGIPNLNDTPPGLYGFALSDVPLITGTLIEASRRPGFATVRLDDGSELVCGFSHRLECEFFGSPFYQPLDRLNGAKVWVARREGEMPEIVQAVLNAPNG